MTDMKDRSFDQVTLQAARSVSRRVSALALGAAGLAGVFAGVDAETAKAKNKKNPCKKQTDQCVAVFTPGCAADPDCLATLDRCCPIIGRCDFDGLFDCFEASFSG
jgi:hypothetical protein